jgi:outer membrane protein TolC
MSSDMTRPIRSAACLCALLLAATAGADAPSEQPPRPLSLEWCLERAARVNPDIAAQAAHADAARERIGPSGALEDPRFSYEASNIPTSEWDFSSTPLSGHQLYLRQKLPMPGTLGNRREAARAGARAEALGLADRQRTIASAVEAAWAELGFSQRALEITGQNIELLRQLVQVAEAKYRVGNGLQQDVLRAQVELTVLLQEQLEREAVRAGAEARLLALLDLPTHGPLPATAPLEQSGSLPRLEELTERLDASSPLLRSRAERAEEARRLVRVAELEGYPDLDLAVGYRIRSDVGSRLVGGVPVALDPVNGSDFFSAGVTLRLPVDRRKWRAIVAERRALARREEAAYRSARAGLHGHLRAAFAELMRADAEARLLATGLVPQARQSLEASRSGYEVGRIGLLSLLDSQVRLLDAELSRVRATADRRLAYAALEAAVGETLR